MTDRYFSVLLREAASLFTAYRHRSPGAGGVQMRHMGVFLGQLMLRSFDRAERVYGAMKCRGFDGLYRGPRVRPAAPADFVRGLVVSGVIIGLRCFNLSLFLGRLAERLR
jgi:cobalt/nickel transport system permease protein